MDVRTIGQDHGQDQTQNHEPAGQEPHPRPLSHEERGARAARLRGVAARAHMLAARLVRRLGLSLALLAMICAGTLAQFAAVGLGIAPVASAHAASIQHGKNTFHSSQDLGKKAVYLPGQVHQVKTPPAPSPIQRPAGVTMQPADLALDPATAAHLRGSDGRLEVTVTAGAVTAAVLEKAGGPVYLHIEEVEGPSGGTSSGHVSLGTYQFTLMGPHGPVAAGLAKPLTLTLHLDGWRGAGFMVRDTMLIVTSVAVTSTVTGTGAGRRATVSTPTPGAKGPPTGSRPTMVKATLVAGANALTATMPLSAGGSSSGSWNTDSPEAQWSKQTDTSVDLPSGDLTYSYPIDVPAGPGGLTPKLQLSYDSAAVTGNHNPQATSGWLGEGWDLSAGSISWGEQNVTATCTVYTCTCPGMNCAVWENSWQMSDPYGNSGELIPSDSDLAPWYDDTSDTYVAGIMNWQLADEGRVKILSYVNPNNISGQNFTTIFPTANYAHLPPCFRVFLPNGYMEEFGCTLDSLQYYVEYNPFSGNNKTNYVYRWDLDMITDPNGNQIHFSYRQIINHSTDNSWPFPIDAVLSDITYDSPACHNASSYCTGIYWQPAVDIHFDTDFAPARLTGAACPTWTLTGDYKNAQTMRCDDVHDLSGNSPAGDGAPLLQSLLALNDIKVQVTTTPSTPSWQTLRTYQFSYDQASSTTTYNGAPVMDPNTGLSESVAGYLDLTKIQELGTDGSTSLPALAMSYTTVDEYYVDAMDTNALNVPQPSGNCGPSFNATNCKMWAQSYNARYLAELDNGRGWSETYTWKLARNNTHGVATDLDGPQDPFACTNASQSDQQTYPCDEADDENWSRVVLTQRQASVLCVAANGSGCGSGGSNALTSTWSYAYTLTNAVAKECGDCTVTMYWGDQNDGDKLDFYNTHFMGFQYVNVTNPDGSLTEDEFNTTMGYGVATSGTTCSSPYGCAVDPWTDPRNALHGRLDVEWDFADASGQTLLKEVGEQYNVTCPPAGIAASAFNANDPADYFVGQNTSELDHSNPVTVCEITPKQEDSYAEDGGSQADSNHTTTAYSYSYDSGGHMTQETESTTANNAGSTPTILKRTQYVWDDNIITSGSAPRGTYLTQVPAIQTTEDGSNNVKACVYTAYDGGASGATGSQSSLTKGLETRTDEYSASCTPGSLSGPVSTTKSYDASGNVLGTQDADAVAGVAWHENGADCTVNSVAESACAQFDSLYDALPVKVTNAARQATQLNYTTDGSNTNLPDASNGWGTWLTTTTDANGQVTAYGYDALGRLNALAKPGDTLSSATTSYTYPVTCAATGAAEPCTALTATQRLSGGTTVTSATYYDGWGRAVETVAPQQDNGNGTTTYVVKYTEYDASGRVSFTSDAYFVTATTASTPPYFRPDTTQAGTSTTYDALGRTLTTTDPLKNVTTTSYSTEQPLSGANISDTAWYEATSVVDANGHEHITLVDGFGRTRYVEQLMGNGTQNSPYALYGTTASSYDWLGDVTSVTGPNNYPTGAAGLNSAAQTTTTYDLLGRVTKTSDADLGNNWTYSYDQDGNLLSSVDARGTSGGGAVYAGYDGLDRQVWRGTNSNGNSPFASYAYDSVASAAGNGTSGSAGIGRLSGTAFTGGTSGDPLSGSASSAYDGRGQVTATTQSLGGVNVSGSGPVGACPVGWSCADIGSPAISGSQTSLGNGVWLVTGSGSDIWNTSDQFHYVSQAQSGDGSVSAQVAGQQQTDAWAKAGVMLRASTAANAAFYAVLVTPQHTISVQARTSSGGSAIIQASAAYTPGQGPTYVQVTRSGTTYSAATSPDGKTWTPISGSSLSVSALSGTVQAGIAVTSHTTGAASTATIAAITPATGGAPANPPASVTSYTLATSYNDAGQPTSLTYSDGEVFTPGYNSDGWLTSAVTVPQGGAQVNLLTNIGYSGVGGAAMHPTSASLGNSTYSYSASFDNDVRLSSVTTSLANGGTTLFSSSRTYDNIGNVATVATTLAAGTDNQAFCYDEQNRLTWAGSTGTPPCTGTPIAAGSLTSAQYSASYSYDALNRLTSTPTLGSYSYGTTPLHGATSTASGGTTQYSASYDAAGDMVCRAPSSATTCTGTVTGQQLTYDGERRVSHWQSSPSNPTSSADYLYDGSGNRIEQVDTNNGASTKVYYVFGGLEELDASGSTSTLTKYYSAGGILIGESVGGTISYLASDGLGSVSEALSTTGTVTAAQLYGPYGGVRYSSGTMPTAKGFTGQRADAISGLDYYGARYYDPVLGQFTSADTKQGPNRFAYVADDPETLTDPTGHLVNCMGCGTTDSCSDNCARPLPGVHVVSDTTSGPVTNSTVNSDFTTTTTTTTYETLTYSNGTTKTFTHTSSKTTCDTTCQQNQAAKRVANAQADATKTSAELNTLAAFLGIVGVALTAIATVAAASIFGAWLAAALVASGLFTLIATLASEAIFLGQGFADEQAYHPDAAWWTVANVAAYGQSLSSSLGAINLGLAMVARGIADIPGLGTMLGGSIAAGLAGGAGLSMLGGTQIIQEGIGEQEADLEGTRNGPS